MCSFLSLYICRWSGAEILAGRGGICTSPHHLMYVLHFDYFTFGYCIAFGYVYVREDICIYMHHYSFVGEWRPSLWVCIPIVYYDWMCTLLLHAWSDIVMLLSVGYIFILKYCWIQRPCLWRNKVEFGWTCWYLAPECGLVIILLLVCAFLCRGHVRQTNGS